MPANTTPIFTLTPNVGAASVVAANTRSDGNGTIGTDIYKVFTAGSNGAFFNTVRFALTASSAATAAAATTFRFYLSSIDSGATTPGTNVWQIGELPSAAQTADQTTSATYYLEFPINRAIPANYTILVSMHIVANANTFWHVTGWGGDY